MALGEKEDGVGHQLAGAVVGDVSAALHVDDLDVLGFQLGSGNQDVGGAAGAADGEDLGMLGQHEGVGDLFPEPFGDQIKLEGAGFFVILEPDV